MNWGISTTDNKTTKGESEEEKGRERERITKVHRLATNCGENSDSDDDEEFPVNAFGIPEK